MNIAQTQTPRIIHDKRKGNPGAGMPPGLLTRPRIGDEPELTLTRKEWADHLGIKLDALHQRINRSEKCGGKVPWWTPHVKKGRTGLTPLLLGKLYKERVARGETAIKRCFLESFEDGDSPDRLVIIRLCGDDENCTQTLTYYNFLLGWKACGTNAPLIVPMDRTSLIFAVEEANLGREKTLTRPRIGEEPSLTLTRSQWAAKLGVSIELFDRRVQRWEVSRARKPWWEHQNMGRRPGSKNKPKAPAHAVATSTRTKAKPKTSRKTKTA